MNENKTNINWLIPIYSNYCRNPLFIILCEDWHLASFIKILLKIDIKMEKASKKRCFLAGIE